MSRLAYIVLVWSVAVHAPAALRADDFSIDLKAQAGKEAKIVEAKFPAVPKKAERQILSVAANTSVTVKWTARKTDQGAVAKDVLVHFFVVKEDRPDQQEVPKLTKGVIAESALTMDFKSQDKAEGEIAFTIPNAGCYLIRLELKGGGVGGVFAALDLLVVEEVKSNK
jgi:hypothetical protein